MQFVTRKEVSILWFGISRATIKCVCFLSDLLRRQEELRRMEELHSQEMQKRKEMQLRYF